MVLELGWLGIFVFILLVIVIYTFILLFTYRKVMDTQQGKFLFNLPLAPFSIKSRINTIKKQLKVKEEDIDYLGDGEFEVKGSKVKVDAFFGVVVKKVDEEGEELGIYDEDVMRFNLPNLDVENKEDDK